jgi:hypothetical protein
LNIFINAKDLKNHPEVMPILEAAEEMNRKVDELEQSIWKAVVASMGA